MPLKLPPLRIAIADDEVHLCNAYRIWLKEAFPGAVVDAFYNRIDAERAFKTVRYDAIVLDIVFENPLTRIKERAGFALVSLLQKEWNPPPPVIVISQYDSEDLRDSMKQLTVWDVLPKNVIGDSKHTLIDMVNRVMGGRRSYTNLFTFAKHRMGIPTHFGGERLGLNVTEAMLLKRLLEADGEFIKADELAKSLYGADVGQIPVYISRIRKELVNLIDRPDLRKLLIEQAVMAGYRWNGSVLDTPPPQPQ